MKKIKTKTVGAYGCLPYNKNIEKGLQFIDRFGEAYSLCRKEGDELWVPRGISEAEVENYDYGPVINYENNFQARNSDQARVIKTSHRLLDENFSFIIQAPTGYGKTYIGAEIISYLKRRVVVVTTKEDIIDQWCTAIQETCGINAKEIGIWRGDSTPTDQHKVVIGLVQSLLKGPERYGNLPYRNFGLVICDEVHRMAAEQFNQTMWHFPARHRIGLSATPYRKDGRDNAFRYHIGPVMVEAQQETMIPKIIMQTTLWRVPMVHWYGSYQKMPHTAGKTMGVEKTMYKNQSRNRMIADFCYAAYKKGRNTIVFSSGLEHLQQLETAFEQVGIPLPKIGWYVGLQNYPKGLSRFQKLEMREQAKIKPIILATYSMASEATDIPWLDCAVLGTPRADVNQIVGRIRREWEGKKQPVVFDLIDNDSKVFAAYAKARQRWYQSVGASIVHKHSY